MKALYKWLWVLVAALALTACGISRIKDISLQSVGVKYITPTSSRSLQGVLVLGIDNPAMTLNLTNVEGQVQYKGKPIAVFTTGELPLEGKSTRQYELPCTVTLADGASLLDLVMIAARRSTEGLTADVQLHAALKNGLGKDLQFKELDLTQFTQ